MKCTKLLLTIMLALLASPAWALDDDHLQPIEVRSDSSQADIASYTLIYSGNVRVKQGSMVIKADQLKITSDPNQQNQILIATGSPATYTQTMNNGQQAEASSREIRYEVNVRRLIMKGDAELSQSGSVVKGETISYNVEKQQLVAEGSKEEQITTIFLPSGQEQQPLPKPDDESIQVDGGTESPTAETDQLDQDAQLEEKAESQ